jgi:hypothetical protein
MTEREQFESWAKGKFNLAPLGGVGDFFYDRENTQAAWDGWNAARRETLGKCLNATCESITITSARKALKAMLDSFKAAQ